MNSYEVSVMGRGEKIARRRRIRSHSRPYLGVRYNPAPVSGASRPNWFVRMWKKFVSIFDKNNFYQSPPSAWPQ